MDRLSQTARIVAASLKNNPHTPASDLPDLIRTIHAALPNVSVAAQPMPAMAAPQPAPEVQMEQDDQRPQNEQQEDQTDEGEADAPRGKMSIHEALAASRARFAGSPEGGEQTEAEAEAEVEAHAS